MFQTPQVVGKRCQLANCGLLRLQATMAEVSAENWSANSRFRCFFAAQQYYLLNSSSPEEETVPW